MGFDLERDIGSIRALLDSSRVDEVLMVDANQGWSAEEALGFATGLGDNNLGWLEEPIRADSDISDWIRLSEAMDIPLAQAKISMDCARSAKRLTRAIWMFFYPTLPNGVASPEAWNSPRWRNRQECGVARIISAVESGWRTPGPLLLLSVKTAFWKSM